jgi:PAS domain S-box-containing protein
VVWTADAQGGFVEPQPSWQEYTGQPRLEYAGAGWIGAVHPEDREAVRAAWAQAQGGGPYEAHVRIWSAIHHGYRHVITRGAPVRAEDRSVREWIGTVTDVEERWLTEERLRHAERLESVGRLAGGIAHEANNQMTVILGAADFVLRAPLPDRVREDVEHIRRAARRTAGITQQLLAFSRRQVLQPQVMELNSMVTGMEPIIRRALGELSRVVLRLDPDPGEVEEDPGQLEQELLKLARNARDAMPEGGVLTIETSTVVLEERYAASKPVERIQPGPYAMLMVSDTGRGIEPEVLSHIFEPFFTTKDVGQGTGLGLATVYGIVKQSGGYVWAYSEPGHGTAFKVYLPLLPSSASRVRTALAAPDAAGHEVILLAEDEALVRGIIARSLRDYGYTVLEAKDGAEALQVAEQLADPPGLLIADVVMPRIGGRTLAARLNLRWPDLPVLFTSGYTGFDAVSRGLLEEGRDFVQKPLDPEVLARKVREMLDTARRQSPTPAQGTIRTST